MRLKVTLASTLAAIRANLKTRLIEIACGLGVGTMLFIVFYTALHSYLVSHVLKARAMGC